MRDVGNSAEWAMSDVRRAIESGWFVGPTIIDSGKIIAPFGGQSRNIPPKQGPFWQFEYIDADGPAEIRKAVRTNIYYGAGVIKLVADNNPYHYSIEEFRAAVDEAHRAGIPVAVHVYAGDALENAIEAGVDSIEHGFDLTDAQMKRMKDKGIFLVGTDFPRAHLDIVGTSGGILPEPAVLAPKIIDRLKRANRIGVRMAFGSDTVIDMPGRTRGRFDVRLSRRLARCRRCAHGYSARHDHERRGAAAHQQDARQHRRRLERGHCRDSRQSPRGYRRLAQDRFRHEGRQDRPQAGEPLANGRLERRLGLVPVAAPDYVGKGATSRVQPKGSGARRS